MENKRERDVLMALYKALKTLHDLCKRKNSAEMMMDTSIIKELRYDLKNKIKIDALEYRQQLSDTMDKCRYFYYGRLNCSDSVRFTPDRYFVNEFKEYMKGNVAPGHLHIKLYSFEFDDKYYSKHDYFLFNNAVYDKKDWKLSEDGNQLINLKKDREFEYYINGEKRKATISLDDGSDFVNNMYRYRNYAIKITTQNAVSDFPAWLTTSMFVINNTRTGENTSICLSEEDIKNIAFKPLPRHAAFFNIFSSEIAEAKGIDKGEAKQLVHNGFINYNRYRIELHKDFGRCNTIAKRLLKKLITNDVFENLNLFQLVEALKLIKRFYGDEKEAKKYVEENKLCV